MKKTVIILIILTLFLIGCSNKYTPHNLQKLSEGTCVDRAIKTYKQMKSKGYEAKIVMGVVKQDGEIIGAHSWVECKDNGEWKKAKELIKNKEKKKRLLKEIRERERRKQRGNYICPMD